MTAQMPVNFNDALATPEAYFNRDIVFHDVLIGGMFRMHIDALGGDTFFLRVEDGVGNFLGGFADVFVSILPGPLARQWADLGSGSLDFRRSNVYGRFRLHRSWVLFEISAIKVFGAKGTVIEVIR